MTTHTETDDGASELPDTWTQGARDTFAAVLEERPDASSAELASLYHAASLESAAERLDAVAQAAGFVSTGSTGQVVVHPAVTEARLARTAAASILARLVPHDASPRAAGARKAARARWSRAGKR